MMMVASMLAHAPLFREGDHVLLLLSLQLVHILDNGFQAAELLHQLHGGLLADPRYAGDVVHRIAHQSEDVLHLFGALQAPPSADLLRPEHLWWSTSSSGFVHQDLVRHQLPEILVRRDHVRGVAFLLGLLRQGSDHVIGLITIGLEDRDVEGSR